MNKLIEKYKVSEEDVYIISCIEEKKKQVGFFAKEKLKAKNLGILKKYNISFMDLGEIIKEIKNEKHFCKQDLIERYGDVQIENLENSSGSKYTIPIILGSLVLCYFIFFTGGLNEKDIAPVLNKTWEVRDSKNIGGSIISSTIKFEITKNKNSGYSYELTNHIKDAYSGRDDIEEFKGDMENKYTRWEGIRGGIISKRTYWNFENVNGKYGLLLSESGFVGGQGVEFQFYNSNGDPGKILMAK